MYRGLIYIGRRGIALHALSGIDIALWDIKGKAEGKPVCELIGTPQRDSVRAYASMLMPDDPAEVRERVSALREQGFTAVKLGWGPLGADAVQDVELAAAAVEAAGEGGTILIDAGLGYGKDAKTAIGVAEQLDELGVPATGRRPAWTPGSRRGRSKSFGAMAMRLGWPNRASGWCVSMRSRPSRSWSVTRSAERSPGRSSNRSSTTPGTGRSTCWCSWWCIAG